MYTDNTAELKCFCPTKISLGAINKGCKLLTKSSSSLQRCELTQVLLYIGNKTVAVVVYNC